MPDSERTPPQDLDAEASILGAMLHSRTGIAEVSSIVTAEDFSRPVFGIVFETIMTLFRRDETADPITVKDALIKSGRDAGDVRNLLAEILDAHGSVAAAPSYARIVTEKAHLRRLIDVGNQVMSLGYDAGDDVPGAIAEAEKLLYRAVQSRMSVARSVEVAKIAPNIMVDLEREAQEIEKARDLGKPEATRGFKLGLSKVDKTLGGIQPGMYVVIGAKTSTGKTSLLIQADVAAALAGKRVAHFTLEMPKRQVVHRIWAQTSTVPVHHLTNPELLSQEDWHGLVQASASIPGGIWVADGAFTITEILAEVRRLQVEQGGIDVVVIDYVQLVKPSPGSRHRRKDEELSEISQALKGLANETGITVLAAAQLSREHEREKRRPTLRDLRDSGSLEHDPDVVMFLHRPIPKKSDGPQLESMKATEVIVAKHRSGPTGLDEVIFDAPRNLFVEGG